MRTMKLLALTLFFIILMPFVLGEEVTNPYPTFSVKYVETNAPITITSVYLKDSFDNLYTLSERVVNDEELPWIFNYTSNDYLSNQEYFFTIDAMDANDNPRRDTFSLTINVDSMPIYVLEPTSPLFSIEESQDFAVGTGLPFDLKIGTAGDVTCRIKANTPSEKTPEEEWGYALTAFNDGSSIETRTHILPIVADDEGSNFVFEVSELNYEHLFSNTFLVVCEQYIDPIYEYHPKVIYLGYDSSAPEYVITFDPPVIFDFSDVSTMMNITTTGDLVACSYSMTSSGTIIDSGDLPEEVTTLQNLFNTKTKEFSYNDDKNAFNVGTRYDVLATVNCTNPAGLWTVEEKSFAIQLSSTLYMTMEERYFSIVKPELILTTNLAANCWFEENNTNYDFESDDGKTHIYSDKTFEEGNNNLNVICRSEQGKLEEKTFTITIDSKKPLAPIIGSGADSCESRISLLILEPEPEDTVSYNVSLYNSSTTTEAYRIFGPEITSFTDDDLIVKTSRSTKTHQNSSYVWTVNAIDRAGNIGPSVKHTMKKVSPDSITCDITPPKVILDIQKLETGFELNISCSDLESGCTNSYMLSKIAPNATCNYSQGVATSYSTNPILVLEDKKFCYVIKDNADNEKTGKVAITLDAQQQIANDCENGFKDLDEEGIDCGGVCGSYPPCPEDETDVYDSDDDENESSTDINDDDFCYDDFDCAYGEVCVDGECKYDSVENKASLLGIILIILGILFIGGGIGYIVYAENQKQEYNKQKALHQQLSSRDSAEMAAKRLVDEKKYLEELKKKHVAGEQKKAKLSKDKLDERSKLFGEFDEDKTKKDESSDKDESNKKQDEPLFSSKDDIKEINKESEEEEEQIMLDEGLKGDFVDVEKLGKKDVDETTQKEKDVFEDLKKINKKDKKKQNENKSSD